MHYSEVSSDEAEKHDLDHLRTYEDQILLQTQMIQALSEVFSDEQLCELAAEFIPRLVHADRCDFYKVESNNLIAGTTPPPSQFPSLTDADYEAIRTVLIEEVLEDRHTKVYNNLSDWTRVTEAAIILESPISIMVIPVFVHHEIAGTLTILRMTGAAFTQLDENLVQQLAAIIGLRLERNYLLRTTNEHLRQTLKTAQKNTLLNEMHMEMGAAASLEQLYQLTTWWVGKILNSTYASIVKLDIQNNRVVILDHEARATPLDFEPHFPIEGSSLTELMIQRQAITTPSLFESPYLNHSLLSEKTGAVTEIAAPLIVDGHIYGAITACTKYLYEYGSEEEQLLTQVASHVALLIDNFNNRKEVEDRASQVERTNTQLNVTIHNLNEREAELRHSLETNKELLGITSHDLKNPLGGIIGLCDMILEDVDRLSGETHAEVLENTRLIQKEAGHMLTIIKNLLDKHRKEVVHEFSLLPTNITELIEEVMRWNQSQAAAKHIQFHFSKGSEAIFPVDASSFQRAIDNLLSNAVKYSPHHTDVWITLQPQALDGSYWKLSIRDEGPGLNEDDMKRVFKKMQRLSAKPTGGEHSTGLGLYIVKQIIEQHGGTVGVDSIHGEGATFWMLLPYHRKFLDKLVMESAILS